MAGVLTGADVPPAPTRRAPWIAIAAVVILVAWSWHGTRVDVGGLLGREGLGQIAA